ncbi:MAG: hypothetical protein WDO74_17495 [Pseudomonadota bacterium]
MYEIWLWRASTSAMSEPPLFHQEIGQAQPAARAQGERQGWAQPGRVGQHYQPAHALRVLDCELGGNQRTH